MNMIYSAVSSAQLGLYEPNNICKLRLCLCQQDLVRHVSKAKQEIGSTFCEKNNCVSSVPQTESWFLATPLVYIKKASKFCSKLKVPSPVPSELHKCWFNMYLYWGCIHAIDLTSGDCSSRKTGIRIVRYRGTQTPWTVLFSLSIRRRYILYVDLHMIHQSFIYLLCFYMRSIFRSDDALSFQYQLEFPSNKSGQPPHKPHFANAKLRTVRGSIEQNE